MQNRKTYIKSLEIQTAQTGKKMDKASVENVTTIQSDQTSLNSKF